MAQFIVEDSYEELTVEFERPVLVSFEMNDGTFIKLIEVRPISAPPFLFSTHNLSTDLRDKIKAFTALEVKCA